MTCADRGDRLAARIVVASSRKRGRVDMKPYVSTAVCLLLGFVGWGVWCSGLTGPIPGFRGQLSLVWPMFLGLGLPLAVLTWKASRTKGQP